MARFYKDKQRRTRPITERKGAKVRSPRLKAADFGDDPKVRHSHGEEKNTNLSKPWERKAAVERGYVLKKGEKKQVPMEAYRK